MLRLNHAAVRSSLVGSIFTWILYSSTTSGPAISFWMFRCFVVTAECVLAPTALLIPPLQVGTSITDLIRPDVVDQFQLMPTRSYDYDIFNRQFMTFKTGIEVYRLLYLKCYTSSCTPSLERSLLQWQLRCRNKATRVLCPVIVYPSRSFINSPAWL